MSDWFDTGYDNLDKEAQSNTTKRFWMPRGTEKEVVFLSDEPLKFKEHQLFLNGHWRNWFTCIRDIDGRGCPLCQLAEERGNGFASLVGAYTVVDTKGYTNKKGEEVTNVKTLLMAKRELMNVLKVHRQRRGTLVGSKYLVNRTDVQTSSATGDQWDFHSKIEDMAKELGGIDLTPFDYKKLFAPKTYEELQKIVESAGGPTALKAASAEEAGDDDGDVVDY